MDSLLAGKDAATWVTALSNKLGCLSQGISDCVVAAGTINFIQRSAVPNDKKVTYDNFICDYRPLKSEPYRVRLTAGGDDFPYTNDAGSPAVIINSTISDAHRGARFLCANLKDHFLASPMKTPEYMRIKYKYFPADMRQK
jgi:hypothetical protein